MDHKLQYIKLVRDKLNTVSPSFCTMKWLHQTLYLHTGDNHSCYHPRPHRIGLDEIAENPAALHNTKHKKEQRKKMLEGERPAECSYCWKIEDLDKETIEPIDLKDTFLDDCFITEKSKTLLKTDIYTIEIDFSSKKPTSFLQVYTPQTRDSIAIEPMTCAPNSFNNKNGLLILETDKKYNWKVDLEFSF